MKRIIGVLFVFLILGGCSLLFPFSIERTVDLVVNQPINLVFSIKNHQGKADCKGKKLHQHVRRLGVGYTCVKFLN